MLEGLADGRASLEQVQLIDESAAKLRQAYQAEARTTHCAITGLADPPR